MCARADQPDQRDQAMARLLADALKRPAAGDACPDAELVAAYADQGLGENERKRLESHFEACERCQHMLAALGASLEAPVGEAIAVMPAAVPAAPRPAAQRWLWWLSPAFGAAAAALLWMVLRPAAPQPVQTAANFPATNEQEARALNAPAASAQQREAPPAAAARRDEQAPDRLAQAQPAENKAADAVQERAFAQLAAPRADAAPPAAPPAAAVRAEVAAAPVPALPPVSTAGSQAAAEAAGGAAGGRFAPTPARTEPAPPVNTTGATLGGALSNETISDLAVAPRSVAQLNLYSPNYTFTSPVGGVQWRVGAAGLIERSGDNGQTWQQQASGVTADLVAGSAASDEVAWVVGRATVILRTVDGQQWQQITPPAGVAGDWVTVVVRSATSATVVGPIRRFSTEDGGVTWTEQQ